MKNLIFITFTMIVSICSYSQSSYVFKNTIGDTVVSGYYAENSTGNPSGNVTFERNSANTYIISDNYIDTLKMHPYDIDSYFISDKDSTYNYASVNNELYVNITDNFITKENLDTLAKNNNTNVLYVYGIDIAGQYFSFKYERNFVGLSEQVNDVLEVSVYPNPVIDYINITYTSSVDDVPIYVYDMFGRVVYVDDNSRYNGTHTVRVMMSDFVSGTYIVKVGSVSKTIIK